MSDIYKINVSMLKSYENDFKNELNNFNNKTYTTFLSSYLKSCSDPYVRRMSNELQTLYDKVKKGYTNIDKWWIDYNKNAEGLENYLSDNAGIGSISEFSIRNSAHKLPDLKKYNIKFSGMMPAGILESVRNVFFANNKVISSTDPFDSLYKDYKVPKANTKEVVNNDNIIDQVGEALSTAGDNVVSWAKDTGSDIVNFFSSTAAKVSFFGKTVVSKTTEVIDDVDDMFDKTKAYISNGAKTLWNKASEWWDEPIGKTTEAFDKVGTAVSNGAKSLWATATDWKSDVEQWWNSDALPWIQEAASAVGDVLVSTLATVGLAVQSLVEGILQFGEAIVDFVALAGSAVASIVTGLIDGGQAIYGAVNGNEWTSITKQMWDGTMGFVSKQYVSGWADDMYQNTKYGQFFKNNAYGFDTVRSVGSGLGYVVGVAALTIATFGVGGAAAAGGSVTVSSAVTATSASQMAITATAAGIGKGTQNAWADGAELLEGLGAGTLNGLWEGFQFYVGGKINGLKVFGSDGVLKSIGTSEVGAKFLNSLTRVVLDGVDGGVEGFVMPAIASIYKDGYYNENGEYIEFTDSDSIFKRGHELFDDNGGWSAVCTQAAIGSAASLLSETFNLRKYFKDGKKAQVDGSVRVADEDIKTTANVAKNSNADVEIKRVESPHENLKIDGQEKIDVLTEFKEEILKGTKSDQQVVDLMYKTFNDAIDNGNLEAIGVLKMFNELKKDNPDLRVALSNDSSSCYWQRNISTIVIGKVNVASGDSGAFAHELGHCLFDCVLGGKMPDNWDSIVSRARVISSYNDTMDQVGNTLYNVHAYACNESKRIYNQILKDDFGLSIKKYQKVLEKKYKQLLSESAIDIDFKLRQRGYDSKLIDEVFDGTIDAKDLANIEIRNDIGSIKDQINRTQFGYCCALSDLIDAVYEGTGKNLKGEKLKTTYCHGREYYLTGNKNFPFHEIIANFTHLKMSGKEQSLSVIRDMFGDKFYETLEETFSKFLL